MPDSATGPAASETGPEGQVPQAVQPATAAAAAAAAAVGGEHRGAPAPPPASHVTYALPDAKPFLGGYRNPVSGTIFHHASAQTDAPPVPPPKCEQAAAGVQTEVPQRSRAVQCPRDASTQCPRPGWIEGRGVGRVLGPTGEQWREPPAHNSMVCNSGLRVSGLSAACTLQEPCRLDNKEDVPPSDCLWLHLICFSLQTHTCRGSRCWHAAQQQQCLYSAAHAAGWHVVLWRRCARRAASCRPSWRSRRRSRRQQQWQHGNMRCSGACSHAHRLISCCCMMRWACIHAHGIGTVGAVCAACAGGMSLDGSAACWLVVRCVPERFSSVQLRE